MPWPQQGSAGADQSALGAVLQHLINSGAAGTAPAVGTAPQCAPGSAGSLPPGVPPQQGAAPLANLNVNINYWHVDAPMTMPTAPQPVAPPQQVAPPQPVGAKMSQWDALGSGTGAQGYAAVDPGSLKGSLWQAPSSALESGAEACPQPVEADVAAGPESTGGTAAPADAADCGTEATKAEVDPAISGTRSFSKCKSPAAPPATLPTQSKSKGCIPSMMKPTPPPAPPPGWTARSKAGAPPMPDRIEGEEHSSKAPPLATPADFLYQALAGPLAGWLSTQPTPIRSSTSDVVSM